MSNSLFGVALWSLALGLAVFVGHDWVGFVVYAGLLGLSLIDCVEAAIHEEYMEKQQAKVDEMHQKIAWRVSPRKENARS